MPNLNIAIIGMAGRFPHAANVEHLRENLREGRESLRPLPKERIATHALPPDGRFKVMGYLDDISTFDHEFFGMVLGEARKLSPNIRLLLEEVWHTFESAGCPPQQFRGSRTDVYMTQTDSVYGDLADEDSATLFTGNAPEFMVARLNRLFDLRGNSMVVDTACSSGLAAALLACDALRLDRADYALVCGANLYIFPFEGPNLLDTASPDGRSRSYSADANGMVQGETVVCFLLTTVERAQKRHHPIQAVIRGGAVNNNAAMSNSPSAPNSVMQAQAMLEAWRRAGIRPEQLGFMEGHGSATQLGDSLEIEAFRLAFKDRPSGTPPCALSSIKANLGHGKSAAALSGLARTVLSVQHGEIYPAPNAKQVNQVLNKPDSPVYVNTDLISWRDERRLAGVHSFGMSGVNCHLVLENVPIRITYENQDEWFPVPVCSRRDSGLFENLSALREWLVSNSPGAFPDVAHTLCLGRQPFEYRHVMLARNCDELARACEQQLTSPPQTPRERTTSPDRAVLLFTNDRQSAPLLRELSGQLAARFPCFRRAMERFGGGSTGDAAFVLATQLALFDLFSTMGISGALAGVGPGKLVAPVVKGSLSATQAMLDADSMIDESVIETEDRVSSLVARQQESGPVVFIQMGCESAVSSALRGRAQFPSRVEVFGEDAVKSMGDIAARLFTDGWAIEFQSWFEDRDTQPARLPGYQFARTRCWLRDQPAQRQRSRAHAENAEAKAWDREWAQAQSWERRIGEIWRELLGHENFGREVSLFDLGGDSLLATRIVRRVNQEFGVHLDFEDMFECPTVAGLARLVFKQSTVPKLVTALWRDVLKVDSLGENDNFFDLGGHSLLASEILLRVRRDFEIVLSFDDFFGVPTVGTFANLVEARVRSKGNGSCPPQLHLLPPSSARPKLSAAAWAEELRRRENA